MSKSAKNRPSISRCVTYSHVGPFSFDVDETLRAALKQGIILEYDDGRELNPWYSGPPGPELRRLRDLFRENVITEAEDLKLFKEQVKKKKFEILQSEDAFKKKRRRYHDHHDR